MCKRGTQAERARAYFKLSTRLTNSLLDAVGSSQKLPNETKQNEIDETFGEVKFRMAARLTTTEL